MSAQSLVFNRHQRRAAKIAANRAGINDQHNGVSHAALTADSFALLQRDLEANDNTLSNDHRAALFALVGLFTKSAQGLLPGRIAFGLPTGMGKTSAIVAWCATLVRLGLDHISVAVAASKVEALCDLKRALVRHGVPEERIGLLYADGGKYSEPRTHDNEDRQIMLVAHARVRMAKGLERFNSYRGKPRSLVIYDESLIASEAKGISVRELRGAVGYLRGAHGGQEGYTAMLGYLDGALTAIETALATAKEQASLPTVVALPEVDETILAAYRSLLPRRAVTLPVSTLFDLAYEDLRVIPTGEGGAVWYEVAVSPALRNIIILDASYPIRELVKADRTIRDAETDLPEVKRIGVALSQLKDHGNVTLHQMLVASGREAMRKDYERAPWDRRVTKEVIEVVKTIPTTEAVLVFVFKTRQGEGVDYRALTLADLERAGIDTSATLPAIHNGATTERPRINVVTWGMETSLNDYAHCQHVVLAGVLHRSTLDLAGAYIGQVNDLRSEVTTATVRELARSEVCHVIYQALSRGSCRVMDNGKARRMTGYILHKDASIQPVLSSVMPGASWRRWSPKHIEDAAVGAIATTTLKVVEHLRSLPASVDHISSRQLKEDAGLRAIPPRSFSEALVGVSSHTPWRRSGRSLMRTFAVAT